MWRISKKGVTQPPFGRMSIPEVNPEVTYVPSQKTMTVRVGNTHSYTLTPDHNQSELPEVYLSFDDTIIQCSLKDSGSDVIEVELIGIAIGTVTVVVCVKATDVELGRLKVTVKQ